MYELFISDRFSAAHQLKGYPGDCARVHGHNWTVTAYFHCDDVGEEGIAVDFRLLRRAMKDLLAEFDHSDLNAHPAFSDTNPTSELIARYLYKRLEDAVEDQPACVDRVTISESEGCGATYRKRA